MGVGGIPPHNKERLLAPVTARVLLLLKKLLLFEFAF